LGMMLIVAQAKQRPKRERWWTVAAWVAAITGMGSLITLIVPRLANLSDVMGNILHSSAIWMVTVAVGAMTAFLLHQLETVRNGKHSVRAYYFGWRHATQYCRVNLSEQLIQVTKKGASIP